MTEQMTDQAVINRRVIATGQIIGKNTELAPMAGAQIALINEETWCIIGPKKRISGLHSTLAPELINCPTVLTTDIPRAAKQRILKAHVSIDGVDDVDAMVADLVNVGGILG